MSDIKPHKPHRGIIHKFLAGKSYEIVEVFEDEKDHPMENGVKSLQEYLGIKENDVCADCYCVVKVEGEGKKHFLIEHKETSSKRDKYVNDAMVQLDRTLLKIRRKRPGTRNDDIWNVFISGVKPKTLFTTKTIPEKRARVLFNTQRNKIVFLRNTKIEVMVF